MITRDLYIKRYDWLVHFFLGASCYWTEEIIEALRKVNCPLDHILDSYESMDTCSLDTGITYSNYDLRETVLVVNTTSSIAEFLDSLDHEKKHLVSHMEEALGIDPWSEEAAYLSGDIMRDIAGDVKRFICF